MHHSARLLRCQALFVAVICLFATEALAYLPMAVLAAIIFIALRSMIKYDRSRWSQRCMCLTYVTIENNHSEHASQ